MHNPYILYGISSSGVKMLFRNFSVDALRIVIVLYSVRLKSINVAQRLDC